MVLVLTENVVTVKFAVLLPVATVTLAGTDATDWLLLVKLTRIPPDGAGADSVMVPDDDIPAPIEFGVTVTPVNVARLFGGIH